MQFLDYTFGCKVLGEGCSSIVYKAKKYKSKQQFAIKLIKEEFLKSEIEKRLLSNEIRIHQTLTHHQNIVNLIEHGKHGNNYLFVIQYCQKGSLAQFLERNKSLSQQQAIYITKQLIKAYKNMYQLKILHRDIKPANILITQKNQIKLCDFGLSIRAQQCYQNSMLRIGTPCFMAPQVARQNIYTYKADIWAIGITFFRMVVGELPYKSTNYENFLNQLKQKRIQKLIPQHLSPQIKSFIIQTLNPNHQQRMSFAQLYNYSFQRKNIHTISSNKLQNRIPTIKIKTKSKSDQSQKNKTGQIQYQKNDDKCNLNKNMSTGDIFYRNCQEDCDTENRLPYNQVVKSNKFLKPKFNQQKTTSTQCSQIYEVPAVKVQIQVLTKKQPKKHIQKIKTQPFEQQNSFRRNQTSTKLLLKQMQKITQIVLSQIDYLRFCTKIRTYLERYFNEQFQLLEQNIAQYIEQTLNKLKSLSFIEGSRLTVYKRFPLYKAWIDLINGFQQSKSQSSLNSSPEPFKIKDFQILLSQVIRQIYLQFDKSIKSEKNCGKILTLDYLICLNDLVKMNLRGHEYFLKHSMINVIMDGFDILKVDPGLIEDVFVGISKKIMEQEYF